MPQRHFFCNATNSPNAGVGMWGARRVVVAGAVMTFALCGSATGQRQMHDANAALAMLEGLEVAEEVPYSADDCDDYVRSEYVSNQQGELEAEIIAELGGIYSPYTDEEFDEPTATDIEHIVAVSEAHRSGMCREERAGERKFFGRDHLNLTLASAPLNRDEKIDCDVADWLPASNRCWFAARVVKVKALYGLTVDRPEYTALKAVLESCPSVGMATRSGAKAAPSRGPTKRYETCDDLYEDYPCGLRSYHKRSRPGLYRMNTHLLAGSRICGRPAVRGMDR